MHSEFYKMLFSYVLKIQYVPSWVSVEQQILVMFLLLLSGGKTRLSQRVIHDAVKLDLSSAL